MKISLTWVFEHIHGDWTNVDVPRLVDSFNKTTAEIAGFSKISFDLESCSLVTVTKIGKSDVTVHSPEWKKDIEISTRPEIGDGDCYLIKKDGTRYRWATMNDFGADKEALLPSLYCVKELQAGDWKKGAKNHDYVLDIDNKSITNRPDMWGHRGVAREIAALLKLPFKPIDEFLLHKVIKQSDELKVPSTLDNPYTISVEDPELVKQYSSLYCEYIEPRPSMLTMAFMLARVDCRPISAIVDGTNYVMLDLGQPMHAFDARKLATSTIMPRRARAKESLVLLDGQNVQLTPEDYVITDGQKPLALAGIMGGQSTAVDHDTQSVFIESAVFDAGTIRKTAARLHVRTDSSARFEKSLDPNQSAIALLRLLKVWHDTGLHIKAANEINCIGEYVQPREIVITHECIEKRLGVSLDNEFVSQTLTRLEFKVREDPYAAKITYIITVPTFRGTKDITIKEDIIEEVGRYFGYGTIPSILPYREMKPFDVSNMMRVRAIKECMAYALSMREVCNYAMFDESFLRELQWEPDSAVTIKNPVSENWRRMATTLMPALIKNIVVNKTEADILRFFEYGRTWELNETIKERKVLAGIFYNQKEIVDFYDAKAQIDRLFSMLELTVEWHKIDTPEYPWLAPYQSAYLVHKGTKIGYAGKANCVLLKRLAEGDAWMFELDADFLSAYKAPLRKFVPVPKYPGVERDVSVIVPSVLTADELTAVLKNVSDKIIAVSLVDFFVKEDWLDKRSLTFRCHLQDPEKTMTTDQVDSIWAQVTQALIAMGAQIR